MSTSNAHVFEEASDAAVACADLVMRSGGKEFQLGFIHEDVPTEDAGWYCHAKFEGARVQCVDMPGPAQAADGLAHMILDGGQCTHCNKRTTTAQTITGTYIHGRTGECVWYRAGNHWKRGCER